MSKKVGPKRERASKRMVYISLAGKLILPLEELKGLRFDTWDLGIFFMFINVSSMTYIQNIGRSNAL